MNDWWNLDWNALYDFLIDSNGPLSTCTKDNENSYVEPHKMEATRPSGPAHVTNLNLNQPVLTGNNCQGHLIDTNHNPPTQLSFSKLILESKEIPDISANHAVSALPLLTFYKTCPCAKSLGKSAPLLVRHGTPPIYRSLSLESKTSNLLLNCFHFVIWH